DCTIKPCSWVVCDEEANSFGGCVRRSSQVTKKSGKIACHRCRFLNRREVPAARKRCPSLDVVHPLQIGACWLAFGNGLVREDTKCRGRGDVGAPDRMTAIVPIIAHGRSDGLRSPVQGEGSAEEGIGRRDIAPRVPLLAEIGRQPRWRIIQSIANSL